MQSKSKKIISISIISISILSIFFLVPLVFAQPSLTLNPDEGPSGTTVTVTGTGFDAGTYRVYFDRDGDSKWDWGEPYKTVTASSGFTTTLTVPSVASGLYNIRAGASPYPYTAIASKPFVVKTVWDKLLEIEDYIDNIEDKPIIFEETCEGTIMSGSSYISITSTENFQVKAVYVAYEDPDDGDSYIYPPELYQDPYYFDIVYYKMADEPIPIKSGFPIEYLSWMGLDLAPAGSGGDYLLIGFYNMWGNGDETLFVKVIVESAQNAVITVDLVPY